MGKFINSLDLVPDLVITSTAVRAKTTLEYAMDAGKWDCIIKRDERVYHTIPRHLLEIVKT